MCWKKVKCNKKWSQLLISSKCTVNLTLVFYSTYNNYICKKISQSLKSLLTHTNPCPAQTNPFHEVKPNSLHHHHLLVVAQFRSFPHYPDIFCYVSHVGFTHTVDLTSFSSIKSDVSPSFRAAHCAVWIEGKAERPSGERRDWRFRGETTQDTLILKELRFLRRSLNLWHLLIYHYAVYFHYICTSNNIVHYFYSGTMCQIANYVINKPWCRVK